MQEVEKKSTSTKKCSDYYAFGLQMLGITQNQSNPNDDAKFTGYLLEQDGDLGLYHAEARMYDPFIGRFMQVDPLTVKFPGFNLYHYSYNNSIGFKDPSELCPEKFGGDICKFLNRFDVFKAFFTQAEDNGEAAIQEVVEKKEIAGAIAAIIRCNKGRTHS
jgi:RHS repeat-associated protein